MYHTREDYFERGSEICRYNSVYMGWNSCWLELTLFIVQSEKVLSLKLFNRFSWCVVFKFYLDLSDNKIMYKK